jgi:hypothetical protein
MRQWSEEDVERLLIEQPAIGADELLVLWSQRSREHMVEMLALDRHATLLLIAISSERSTPEVIGQVLESLWSYSDITLQELADEYRQVRPPGNPSLEEAFADRFGTDLLTVGDKPRVVIIGSGFGPHTTLGVRYLERRGVDVRLVQATAGEDQRPALTAHTLAPLVHTQKMQPGEFGIGRGRLFCVLQGGNPAVLWEIGRQAGDAIALVPAHALAAGALRPGARILAPVQPPATVDLSRTGTLRRSRDDPAWTAREIGRVTARVHGRGTTLVIAAVCRDDVLQEFRSFTVRDFSAAWPDPQQEADTADWSQLLAGRGSHPVTNPPAGPGHPALQHSGPA